MIPDDITRLAQDTLTACRGAGVMVVTVESCTGGLIAAALTSLSGSSHVVDRGFVTYSNESKTELVGVPAALIAEHGAVSEPVARAMAEGGIAHSRADIAVSVTGVAGPGGGTPEKPVGLVHFATARRDGVTVSEHHVLPGNRASVREASVRVALEMIRRAV